MSSAHRAAEVQRELQFGNVIGDLVTRRITGGCVFVFTHKFGKPSSNFTDRLRPLLWFFHNATRYMSTPFRLQHELSDLSVSGINLTRRLRGEQLRQKFFMPIIVNL
ncbi:MAG TPA: hypothetical protein VJQ55_08800 [Candidatus Binatia bacterium]|nr:hypothetical protein [Candidatus Binatia bacterium]